MSSRQDNFHGDHVVLLDNDGNPIGTAPRLEVHTTETPLHLAFSTYLFNSQGELLLTRRALSKRTWPGVWTNSCCGHPKKGEDISRAARRRIKEELGLNVGPLTEVLPDFRYTATDASGIVENEICPVFAGFVTDEIPEPDPNEVMDVLWVPWADLVSSIEAVPALYSPWAVLQVAEMGADMPKIISPAQNSPDLTAALADVEQLIQAEITKLSRKWRSFNTDMGIKVLPYDFPDWLDNLLIGKGKRLRVMMSYWGFIAAGGRIGSTEYQNMLKAAAALEILHLFALVHDDVMDESDSRRGQPSAHIQASSWHNRANAIGDGTAFGRNLAILLGDLAHTAADALIDELPATLRNFWYELCIELIVGQRCDLVGAAAARRDMAHAEQVSALKSGAYSIKRPLQMGALAAGGSDQVLAVLSEYGDHIGQAFGLRDDYLGIWGDPKVTGKPARGDLLEAKATVILALASQTLTGKDAKLLAKMGTPKFSENDAVALADAIQKAGIADELEDRITAAHQAALEVLDSSLLVEAGVSGLKSTATMVCWRTS